MESAFEKWYAEWLKKKHGNTSLTWHYADIAEVCEVVKAYTPMIRDEVIRELKEQK